MRLKVFSIIDETLELLQENQQLYEDCLRDVRRTLRTLLGERNEMVMDIRGRIKTKESLRESFGHPGTPQRSDRRQHRMPIHP